MVKVTEKEILYVIKEYYGLQDLTDDEMQSLILSNECMTKFIISKIVQYAIYKIIVNEMKRGFKI